MNDNHYCMTPKASAPTRQSRVMCQVSGCRRLAAADPVEIDLPMAWEATREFTALTVTTNLCRQHCHDVAGRVHALLQARVEFHDLLSIIEMAVRYEKALELRLSAGEAATA